MLGLVVKELGLSFIINIIFKLTPNNRVPQRNKQCTLKIIYGLLNQLKSNIHHDGVEVAKVTFDGEGAITINTGILRGHPVARYSHVVKSAPTIIFAMVAKLWADVTSIDAFDKFPSIGISDLNDKRHDTVGLIFDY